MIFQNIELYNVSEIEKNPDGDGYIMYRAPKAVSEHLGAQGQRLNRGGTGVELRFEITGEEGADIDLRINSALVRRGKVSYHIDSEPDKPQGVFDPNHIQIKNLLATLTMKSLTGDSLNLFVKRLSFEEKSGFSLDRLRFRIEANRNICSLSQIEIQLPRTQITSEAAVIDISQARTLSDYLYKVHFNYRINRAKELLIMEHDRKVQEIAHDVGYTDASHFIVMFKKLTGMTPVEFRKLHV